MAQTIPFTNPLRGVHLIPPRTGFPPAQPGHAPAETEADGRERAAYERGRREGEEALREQLLAQRSEFMELQRGVRQSLDDCLPQVKHDAESALITLALEAAQKLVSGLPVSIEMIEGVVREALAQTKDTAEITVLLHAEDLALLQKHASPLLSTTPGQLPIHFRSSPEVTRGGCLVKTHFGVVDARRETKLELLKENLLS